MTSEPTAAHASTARTPVIAGLLVSFGSALLWVLLAAWRPDVTLHLAPVLVAGAGPYVAWTRAETGRRRAMVLAGLGATLIAVATTLGLSAASWLEGPTWFATDATREAAVLIGVTAALTMLGAVLLRSDHPRGPDGDRGRR